ncbi:MAG: Ig-like domain-containing protein [Gemmatimonadota bacterium]
MKIMMRLVPLALALLAACKEPLGPVATEVLVSPTTSMLEAIGDTVRFSAQVVDQNGTQLSNAAVTWSSSNPAVATVHTSTGVAIATGAGTATITARASDVSATAQVTVQQRVAAFSKVAGDDQIAVAGTALRDQLVVIVADPRGKPIQGATVTWRVTKGGGSVGSANSVTDAAGRAAVTWTLGPLTSTQSVSVGATGLPEVSFAAIGTFPGSGFLAGGYEYSGPYPAEQQRTLTIDGRSVPVTFLAGQLVVYFKAGTAEATASAILKSAGGTVLARVPKAGYYLFGVTPGSENAVLGQLVSNAAVRRVLPHVNGKPSGSERVPAALPSAAPVKGVTVIDDCKGVHGAGVTGTITNAGGTVVECLHGSDNNQAPANRYLIEIYKKIERDGLNDAIINISANGGNGIDHQAIPTSDAARRNAEQEWKSHMTALLDGIASIPPELRGNLVVTISAGNSNIPLTPLLAEIREDPTLAALLKKHVFLVAATDAAYRLSNDAPGDPDVALMRNATCSNGITGTSCSAPDAAAVIQKVAVQAQLDGGNALLATKIAVAANANHELDVTEAIQKGNVIRNALSTDSPNAANVTAISFTAVGATTAAAVTPAFANVTVSYTVSGTDGYFLSGTARTDGSGRVSFAIEPGQSGVKDTISVTAVVAGITRTTVYTW